MHVHNYFLGHYLYRHFTYFKGAGDSVFNFAPCMPRIVHAKNCASKIDFPIDFVLAQSAIPMLTNP